MLPHPEETIMAHGAPRTSDLSIEGRRRDHFTAAPRRFVLDYGRKWDWCRYLSLFDDDGEYDSIADEDHCARDDEEGHGQVLGQFLVTDHELQVSHVIVEQHTLNSHNTHHTYQKNNTSILWLTQILVNDYRKFKKL